MKRTSSLVAVPLIKKIYSRNGVGCCMHIVTDDYNLSTDSVQWCLNHATERNCQDCIDCAKVMLTLTVTARKKAINLAFKNSDV